MRSSRERPTFDPAQDKNFSRPRILTKWAVTSALILSYVVTASGAEPISADTRLYNALRPTVTTRAPFITNLSATPGIPPMHVKVFDWSIGRGRAPLQLSFDGPAVLELRSGRLATTIGGQTVERRAPEVWIVPQGQTMAVRTTREVAALHGLVFAP
jgi:hypothetical protein